MFTLRFFSYRHACACVAVYLWEAQAVLSFFLVHVLISVHQECICAIVYTLCIICLYLCVLLLYEVLLHTLLACISMLFQSVVSQFALQHQDPAALPPHLMAITYHDIIWAHSQYKKRDTGNMSSHLHGNSSRLLNSS